jgi:hypothetical protein
MVDRPDIDRLAMTLREAHRWLPHAYLADVEAALDELVARLKDAEADRDEAREDNRLLAGKNLDIRRDRDRLQLLLDQLEAIVTAKQPPDEVFRFFQRLHGLPEVGAPDPAWGPDHPSYDEMGQ